MTLWTSSLATVLLDTTCTRVDGHDPGVHINWARALWGGQGDPQCGEEMVKK